MRFRVKDFLAVSLFFFEEYNFLSALLVCGSFFQSLLWRRICKCEMSIQNHLSLSYLKERPKKVILSCDMYSPCMGL